MLATNDNLIAILVREANSNLTAAAWAWWTFEVLTLQNQLRSVWILGHTVDWVARDNSGTLLKHEVAADVLPVDVVLVYLDDGIASVIGWGSWADILNVRDLGHVPLLDDDWAVRVTVPALVVDVFGGTIMILKLVKKHTCQMDFSVSSCLGAIWQDVFNDDALEVLVGVWSISEMEGDIVGVLLAVAGHCHNNRSWYRHWLRLHNNISIRCRLHFIHNLTKAYLLVAHVWMVQTLTDDVDCVGFVHWSIWWLYLFNIWIIIVEEGTVGIGEGLSVG